MMADIEKCKGVLIYGAGYFANVLYNVMKHYKVQNKVEAFIVEKKENNPNAIDNIPVREYKDFMNSDESVIIALSHEKQDIVCNSLIDEGFTAERMHELNNITLNALFIVNETIFDSAKYWNQRYSEGELWSRLI